MNPLQSALASVRDAVSSLVNQASEEDLRVALLLSTSGGFLDAFTWVGHGGVFANAQTGNIVLLGLSLAAGHWQPAVRHLLPIVAFFCGIFAVYHIRSRVAKRDLKNTAMWCLGLEIALLIVVAFLPRTFPDNPIVLGIAFVAALQSTSFNKVLGIPYSSVMTTGNLRRSAEALFDGMFESGGPAALHQTRVFGAICAMFCLGALFGGLATSRLGNRALVIVIAILFMTLVMCRTRRRFFA